MDYEAFQRGHKTWVDREYPDQPDWMPAAGMVEEAGELMRAVLKLDQTRAFGTHPRDSTKDWNAELMDAVGDCAIYCCSMCNAMKWSFAIVATAIISIDESWSLLKLCAELTKCAASVADSRSIMYTELYMCVLKRIATLADLDFDECIDVTWEQVRRRSRTPCA